VSGILQYLGYSIVLGLGATAFMDLWAAMQRRFMGVPSLSYCMVGRWVAHIPNGRLIHQTIADARRVENECALGWTVHYAIGVMFAGLLLAIWGTDWILAPSFMPAIIVGLGTVLAPFLILQPGMGAGLAASKTPKPNVSRFRSLVAHASFGLGLYVCGVIIAAVNQGVSVPG